MVADLDEIAAAVRPQIDRTLSRLMNDLADQFEAEDVVGLPPDTDNRLGEMLRKVYRTTAEMAGQPMIDGMKDCFPQFERKQTMDEFFDQVIAEFIEQFGAQKIFQIAETTRRQVMRVIQQGQQDGLGVREIASMLRQAIPEFSRVRSEVIARTEAHGSSQYAQFRTAQQSTRPLAKTWLSVEDPRTRDFGEGDGQIDEYNHRSIDGQRVAMEQPFFVPTIFGTREPLMYPGDPRGGAGNVINCRCSMTFRRADRA